MTAHSTAHSGQPDELGLIAKPHDSGARLPIARAALAQIGALIAVSVVFANAPGIDPLAAQWAIALVFLQGAVAAALGFALKLDWWWAIINASMPALVAGAQWVDISAGYYPAAFCLLSAIYWTTFKTRVPLYLTSRRTSEALLPVLGEQPFHLLDAGSGTGTLLRKLAPHFPAARFTGIENAPIPFLISRILGWRSHRNCRILWGDFWRHRFEPYDIVYAFLSPVPMSALWVKACAEMRPGAMLVSNSFPIPNVSPWRIIETGDSVRERILIYRIPERTSPTKAP